MERRSEEEDTESSRDARDLKALSTIEAIKIIASNNARAPLDTEQQLLLFLQSWWSRLYNRPLKDPILLSYTLEELLYEFYDRIERSKAEEERLEQEDVKIEEEKDKEAEDWAEKMEREELEAELRKKANTIKPQDPTKDLNNIAWMEEQINKGKELYGESFGEDIQDSFDE